MCTPRGNARLFGLTAAARILYNIGKEAIFMTTQKVARLIDWLKSKGLSDSEVVACIKYVATGIQPPEEAK